MYHLTLSGMTATHSSQGIVLSLHTLFVYEGFCEVRFVLIGDSVSGVILGL